MGRRSVGIGVVAVLLWARGIEAQEPSGLPGSVAADLAECTAAAAVESRERMAAAASRLEAMAAAMEAARPVDALVIRARVRTQCQVPFSSFVRQGALVAQANELLERALAMDPRHLVARFTLGMNHFRAPAFMGRTEAAVQELERLLGDHGDRTDPVVASAYLYLGDLYERQGRGALAAETWMRGAERFPSHAGLREKAGPPDEPTGEPSPAPHRADALPATAHALPPIHVAVSTYSVDDPQAATRLSRLDVYTMPGGTADVFQTFQTLPGVTRVGDGGDLYVRGGDPAETPIYVDGARLFHPGRFETLNGSIFGVFDPSVMRTAYFSSGGFSARYGNALSGIVALETDRRPTTSRWRAGANLVSVGGTVWQPLGARAGLWSTGMMTHTGLLLALHDRTGDYPEPPTSRQLMVGAAVEPVHGLELRVGALDVADRTTALVSATGYDGPFRSESATRLATAEARVSSADGRAKARLTLAASARETRFRFGVLDRDHEDRQTGGRLDGELEADRVTLRAGVEVALLNALADGTVPAGPGVAPGSPVVRLDGDRREADHLGGYTEIEWRVARRIALLGGLRADGLPGETDHRIDPRLAGAYSAGDWTLRVGGGRFSQGPWRTRYQLPDGGGPAGVPLRARHLVAGIQRDGAPALRAEAYIKHYGDYVAEPGADDAAPRVVSGRAVGLDVLFRPQTMGPVLGWLTYSYLHGELELDDGSRVPSRYDVTHTLTAVGKLSVHLWELGLTGRYGTGRPYTPILGSAPTAEDGPAAPLYGLPHSLRLPSYSRLDGRLSRIAPVRGGIVAAYVEGLNVLDRGNVMAYTYDAAYANPQPVRTFFGHRTLVFGVEAQF
jgi:vitamin B12 transporter